MAVRIQSPVPGCTRHPGMGFVYVCESCENKLICVDCVTDSHNGHTLGKLTDHVVDQKREIQQYVHELSKTDTSKIEELKDVRVYETNGGRYQKVISDIKRQGKQMKYDIDSAIALLVKMCTESEKINRDISDKNETADLTKHLREDLKPRLDRHEQELTPDATVDVTTLGREMENTSIDPPSPGRLQTVEFKPGTVSSELLERMLGKVLVDGEVQSYKPIPFPVLLSDFKTSFLFDVCRTCPTGDTAWFSHWGDEYVYRLDIKGNVKEEIKCELEVQAISVSPTTGRGWLCVCEDQSIREITTGGAIVTRFTVHHTPASLCITSDDMAIVGMEGEIQIYTTDGRAVSDGAGSPCRQMAVWPHHLASCKQTGDVAAVDSEGLSYDEYIGMEESDIQPHVIVMDKYLNRKFIVKDFGTTESKGTANQPKCYPHDVCFDSSGDVLVTETVTKSVRLIDGSTGRCMKTFYESYVHVPCCISLHEDGTFWIGHGTGYYMAVLGNCHQLAEKWED
ncbi:uncharacterized protein LOC117320011 [Pecten maximus]|uniref:uncharacterized protein LOC117320011 n=1 Tax=Pecten maximus TaxID=6579 RepID=UPI00145825F2|nr:uncharacterized protein LOC117320011 [Pecten maximus]